MKRQRVEDIVRHCGHVFGSDNSQQQECFAEELEDGDGGDYFFARGLIPRDRVMAAREHVLQAMRDRGDLTIQANGSEIVTNGKGSTFVFVWLLLSLCCLCEVCSTGKTLQKRSRTFSRPQNWWKW
jgi:hypothetical protein